LISFLCTYRGLKQTFGKLV